MAGNTRYTNTRQTPSHTASQETRYTQTRQTPSHTASQEAHVTLRQDRRRVTQHRSKHTLHTEKTDAESHSMAGNTFKYKIQKHRPTQLQQYATSPRCLPARLYTQTWQTSSIAQHLIAGNTMKDKKTQTKTHLQQYATRSRCLQARAVENNSEQCYWGKTWCRQQQQQQQQQPPQGQGHQQRGDWPDTGASRQGMHVRGGHGLADQPAWISSAACNHRAEETTGVNKQAERALKPVGEHFNNQTQATKKRKKKKDCEQITRCRLKKTDCEQITRCRLKKNHPDCEQITRCRLKKPDCEQITRCRLKKPRLCTNNQTALNLKRKEKKGWEQ